MSDQQQNCIFCKILAGELPATVVHEDERTVAFMDIYPATRGHVVVVPKRHAEDLHAIDPDDLAACTRAAQLLAGRVRDRLDADGVNLLNSCGPDAWQSVFHFHIHVIPRYKGDPLKLPWVPAPADQRELSEAAERLGVVRRVKP